MLRKLDIVVMKVRNWHAAVGWYQDTLGLELLYKEVGDEWCQLAFPEGGAAIALLGSDDIPDGDHGFRCIPDILVDDLDGTVRELTNRGVRFDGPIRDPDEGYRIATMLDPEGNRLQLYEYV